MRISDWRSDVCSSDLVWRGVVFRDYETPGLDLFEVCVADGVITFNECSLPDELTVWQARAVSALFGAAAEELGERSEEHTSELQSLMRISYAVFCLKKKTSIKCRRGTILRTHIHTPHITMHYESSEAK